MRRFGKLILAAVLLGGLGYVFVLRMGGETGADRAVGGPVPVEVAVIEHGTIRERRTFSGTLEARAEFVVAPKVSGRIESIHVDIGDRVEAGAVVAEMDDDEFQQAVAEAAAQLEVARANVELSHSALQVAESAHARIRELQERQIAPGAELDVATADLSAARAALSVAEARVRVAEAALEAERIRLGYAKVTATWSGDGVAREVAERFVDEGATVRANDPIATVVDAATVRAVFFVTDRDYARLEQGQEARVHSDAYPTAVFVGRVARRSPVFAEASRQARIEVEVPNADGRLRPGTFVRIEVTLAVANGATIVPIAALVKRDGANGVLVVDDAGGQTVARFVPVVVGIRAEDRVELRAAQLEGRVVTLGQQLVDDGTPVRVLEDRLDVATAEGVGG